MDASRFGPALKREREAAKVSQDALAKRAGTTRKSVERYEAGTRSVPLSIALRLCAALGKDLDDMLREEA